MATFTSSRFLKQQNESWVLRETLNLPTCARRCTKNLSVSHVTYHLSHVTCDTSHVTSHVSHVMCHMSCVTCFVLPIFLSMLVKAVFVLKPLEARNLVDGTDNKHRGIMTYRLNQVYYVFTF